MTLTVLKPGLLTTIQDLGRTGYQKHGMNVSGAMDTVSLRIANLLVGNDEGEGVLEITLSGPTLQFEENTLLAITGGNLSPVINKKAIPMWKPIYVKKGSVLSFGPSKYGCRCYIAVAGGFSIANVLGSKSTNLRAHIGGFNGRTLDQGDKLNIKALSDASRNLIKQIPLEEGRVFQTTRWTINRSIFFPSNKERVVRLIRGPHFDWFTQASKEALFNQKFKVSPQSDRMGYRLTDVSLTLDEPIELLSEAVTFGTVQVPPDGNPIILLADRQTIGGYPRIGQIAAVDLPVIAQAKSGEKILFKEITLEEAQELFVQREKEMAYIKAGISLKEFDR